MVKEKYAFLMIDYEMPEIIRSLHDEIPDEELYLNEEYPNDYGREMKTHLTLVPCLPNDCDINMIKSMLRPLSEYAILLTNVSAFENDEYDVLKCDAASDIVTGTNKRICDVLPTFTEYKDYHPHVTVAYMKPGLSGRYHKDVILPLVVLKPKNFVFSYYDENDKNQKIIFTNE